MHTSVPPNPGLRQSTSAPAGTQTSAGDRSLRPEVEVTSARVRSSGSALGQTPPESRRNHLDAVLMFAPL